VPAPSGGIAQPRPDQQYGDCRRDSRLDQVVMGFLKFARPDELRLQPVQLSDVISEVVSMTDPGGGAAQHHRQGGVRRQPADINADPACCSRQCSTWR
jgi:hypothetical protein